MSDRGRTALVPAMARCDARPGKRASTAFQDRRRTTPLQAKLSMLRMEFNRASRKLSSRCERFLASAEFALRQVFSSAR